ncbi:MAG: hypothetical protein GY909_01080 [Oligoflexia bacterium]|nr:hypothetical protein [Oligoflexia bacterium]
MKLILIFLVVSIATSANDRLLFIGDSQTEGFLGNIVHQHLKRNSTYKDIKVIGVGGSSPRHWADKKDSRSAQWLCERTGRVDQNSNIPMAPLLCPQGSSSSAFEVINSESTMYVIFQFLGNSMGRSEDFIKSKVESLLGSLRSDQKCLFTTSPPYFKELTERNILRRRTQDYIVSAIQGRCDVVIGFTDETLNNFASKRDYYLEDKIHLTYKGAMAFFEMFKAKLP